MDETEFQQKIIEANTVRMDYVFSTLMAIPAITFIGIGFGLMTAPGVGYITIGIGYLWLFAGRRK